jgi:hypothetical protein
MWFRGPNDCDLMATYHPAYVLRLTGGNITAVKKLVWADLLAVRAKLDALAHARGASAAPERSSDEEIELKLDL